MNKIILIFGLILSYCCNGQELLTFTDEMPTYGKGKDALTQYLVENIQYPDDALKNNIEGRVVVKFVINEDGSVSDIVLLKKVYPSIDDEAIRVVKAMSNWNPAKQNQKPVKFVFMLPIAFNLNIPIVPFTYEWMTPHEPVTQAIPPSFEGGQDSLNTFVWKTLVYPPAAKQNGIEGTVNVQFEIDAEGNIIEPKANKLGWGLTEEALRIVSLMPKWIPGKLNQKPAPALVTISITFLTQGGK